MLTGTVEAPFASAGRARQLFNCCFVNAGRAGGLEGGEGPKGTERKGTGNEKPAGTRNRAEQGRVAESRVSPR